LGPSVGPPSPTRAGRMPISRPQSAPVVRAGHGSENAEGNAQERRFDLRDLLKDEHHHEIGPWWAGLPVVGRARGRWVFIEPEGLSYPRQRARREILDVPSVDDLDIPDEDAAVERHNKCQHFKPLKGPQLHAWKQFALRTTNQVYQKVPEPDPNFGPGVWLIMFRKSHGGLLKPAALDLVREWQTTSTLRQRQALSELLWSFKDHLTFRRGRTETVAQYGPKQGELAKINLIDPFASSLGRPSSAPIAHAVQRKFEAQKRAAEAAMLAKGAAAREARAARPKSANPFERREVETLKSQIPIKRAMRSDVQLESSNQAQMRAVGPKDLAMAIAWNKATEASCPPATSGMGRCLGKARWHGDAMYGDLWAAAAKGNRPCAPRAHELRASKPR